MNCNAFILDGYVDEPACLGVSPSVSPYIRTTAGVLAEHGYTTRYCTIDQLRKDPGYLPCMEESDLVLMVAGTTVPGKYLGGTPATLSEVEQVGNFLHHPLTLLAGPILFGYSPEGGKMALTRAIGGFDSLLDGSPPEALDSFLNGGEPHGELSYTESDRWSVLGAGIIAQHPRFPHLICELETARGCPRTLDGGCSFCTERFYGPPHYRTVDGIGAEVEALTRAGARHFRLGRQPDLLVYGSDNTGFPRPKIDRLERLFTAVRRAAPDLKTLHIDNVNPATIARHEEASREALSVIISHHTPGDVAAFGMETADIRVVQANNLKAVPEEVFRAVEIVNEAGGERREGIPELLPGLNFVIGLAGETPDTFAQNRAFLEHVLKKGLLLRRINIRKLMPFAGTPAYTNNTLGKHEKEFREFKEFVREKIDPPLLREVFPQGTVLKNVIIEECRGSLSFGRQLGSYPILAGIPVPLPIGHVTDVIVVDWGSRSVTALPSPIAINELSLQALAWIPGVGRAHAALLMVQRPIRSLGEFRRIAGRTPLEAALSFRHPAAPSP
ncbi:MAG: radical SAM protein [Methanomicrobiales archaeon]|nr:radical SAM protein [Methanomicrobiales archaeon]